LDFYAGICGHGRSNVLLFRLAIALSSGTEGGGAASHFGASFQQNFF